MTLVTQDLKFYHVPSNTTCNKKVKVVTRPDKEVKGLEKNTLIIFKKKLKREREEANERPRCL